MTVQTTGLDAGWLAKELEEIPVQVALNRDPGMGLGTDGSLTPSQAERLREAMADRFRKWTGLELLNTRQGDST